MGTVWTPLLRQRPRSWLLGNGEILHEPPLEESGSRLKIRFAGARESVYTGGLHTKLTKFATDMAARKGTEVLIETTHDVRDMATNVMGYDIADHPAAVLAPVHDPSNRKATTRCWWVFRHPTMPYEVTLSVTMTGDTDLTHTREVALYVPTRMDWHSYETRTSITKVRDSGFETMIATIEGARAGVSEWGDFVKNDPAEWATKLLSSYRARHPGARAGVKDLLAVIRKIEKYDHIEIPDLTTPTKPGWMTLDLVSTNVNGAFVSDMVEYLDGAPAVEVALGHYENLMSTLRSMGLDVRMGSAADNDFTAAMLAGETGVLNMTVYNVSQEAYVRDGEHAVSVHLPTGTVVVECNKTVADADVIAAKWEEAKTIARLTGEEDELLAYARAYSAEQRAKRAKNVIKARS